MDRTSGSGLVLAEQVNEHDVYYHGLSAVLASRQTPFQFMEVVQSRQFGKMLLLDGDLQLALSDEFIYHEALVHPACVQTGAPERALILGGGDGGAAREILKWTSIRSVVLVDIDRMVLDFCRDMLPELHAGAMDDPRLTVVAADGGEFVRNCSESFDVIISDLTTPSEGGPSEELFSPEFMALCRDLLAPGGVYATQAGSAAIQEAHKLADLRKDVLQAFPEVRAYAAAIPSFLCPWAFLMARSDPFSPAPAPTEADALLARSLNGPLLFLDGAALHCLMQPAKLLEDVFAAATQQPA